jgi:hypothetical protein
MKGGQIICLFDCIPDEVINWGNTYTETGYKRYNGDKYYS